MNEISDLLDEFESYIIKVSEVENISIKDLGPISGRAIQCRNLNKNDKCVEISKKILELYRKNHANGWAGIDSNTFKRPLGERMARRYMDSLMTLFAYAYSIDWERDPQLADLDFILSVAAYMQKDAEANKLVTQYANYPRRVHLETQAICNARCSFCPYQTMERKGEVMPNETIEKLIVDLSEIPKNHPFQVNPYKVNEPFLDPRLSNVINSLLEKTHCNILLISNFNHLPSDTLNQLRELSKKYPYRISLSASLNEIEEEAYKTLMKLNLPKTLSNLDMIHTDMTRNELKCSLTITNVPRDFQSAQNFYNNVSDRFPNARVNSYHRNTWIDNIADSSRDAILDLLIGELPCSRWNDLSIMANGNLAMCCMDAEGIVDLGSASTTNAINLYREKNKSFWLKKLLNPSGEKITKLSSLKRRQIEYPCKNCNYFQPGQLIWPSIELLLNSFGSDEI